MLGGEGVLASVDDDDALGVLDREGVDRKRLRPLAVEDRVQQAASAMADAPSRQADVTATVPVWIAWIFISRSFAFSWTWRPVRSARSRRIRSATPSANFVHVRR